MSRNKENALPATQSLSSLNTASAAVLPNKPIDAGKQTIMSTQSHRSVFD